MSAEAAKKLFDGMKGIREAVQAVAPGLKGVVAESTAEASRLGTQGAMELASALFGGSGTARFERLDDDRCGSDRVRSDLAQDDLSARDECGFFLFRGIHVEGPPLAHGPADG